MAFLKFSRDKRGYEHFSLVQPTTRRGKTRPRVLYWFRTPPNVKVGRQPFDDETRRALEAQNPGVGFDWRRIVSTPIPPADAAKWRERRRAERAARTRVVEHARAGEADTGENVEPEGSPFDGLRASEPEPAASGSIEPAPNAGGELAIEPAASARGELVEPRAGDAVTPPESSGGHATRHRRRHRRSRRGKRHAPRATGAREPGAPAELRELGEPRETGEPREPREPGEPSEPSSPGARRSPGDV